MKFGWASPDYLLNEMTLEQIFMYYDYLKGELEGKPAGPNKHKPNKKKFYDQYGNKIKTPNKNPMK